VRDFFDSALEGQCRAGIEKRARASLPGSIRLIRAGSAQRQERRTAYGHQLRQLERHRGAIADDDTFDLFIFLVLVLF
jgi:hypothetical protein